MWPNRSDQAASTAADDDYIRVETCTKPCGLTAPTRQQVLQLMMTILESKLAQTHVALTGPKRQQVLQLMMTRLKFCFPQPLCFVISVYHFQNLNSIHFFIYSIGFAISSLVLISFFYKYSNGLKLCVKCIGYADICHDL